MNTVKSMIEGFVYDHIQYFADLVAREGEDARFHGFRVLDDKEKFVHGMLVNAAAALYVHYVQEKDPRAEETFARLEKFIGFAAKEQCKTWGKLSILRALSRLKKAGFLEKLNPETLKMLKEKTEYTDFFDKEKVCTIGYATNYVQVAMACAAFRESLGWDSDSFSDVIQERLLEIMQHGSDTGWMDEQPPYGRFDRYSLVISSEIADNFEDFGKEVPESVKKNLLDAAEAVLFMANKKGDGINYGRSLSCHGDGASLEILASALALGLLGKDQHDRAVAYSIHILEKLLGFWYNEEKKSFDFWWNGRNTNGYRGIHRIMEVNLDMSMQLLAVLHNFELAGLADHVPAADVENPKVWEARTLCFIDRKEQVAQTVILRRGDTAAMLPLIGLGKLYQTQAYMPYPAICGSVEGSPEGKLPFLVPEYVLADGRTLRPIQYFESVETVSETDCITVIAKGRLCSMQGKLPEKCAEGFTSIYRFQGEEIRAEFTVDCSYESCSMLVAMHGTDLWNDPAVITGEGFSDCSALFGENETLFGEAVQNCTPEHHLEFHTPHGPQKSALLYRAAGGVVGYRIVLPKSH